jgi:hypothetical protein
MAMERSELEQRRGELTRSLPAAPTRGAVDSFDHPGLFIVPLKRPRAMSAAAKAFEPPGLRPGRGRVAPPDRRKGGLHRYCSGCVRETKHVAWTADGRGSTLSIRWPTAKPAAGTTICLDCGQLRAASAQPRPPAWSNWPRTPLATRSLALAANPADTADDWAPETAAENEGMPPKREPRRQRRSSPRLTRPRAVVR